jgi:Family of unknown function (DUF6527)
VLKWITAFIARLAPRLLRRRRYSGLRVVERVSDVPEDTGSFIYLVQRNDRPQWAILDCPCRTGHRLSVNLRLNEQPHWSVRQEGQLVTVHPSLWYKDQCCSHFWITRNEVRWV